MKSTRGGVGHAGVEWGESYKGGMGHAVKQPKEMLVLRIKISPHQNHFWKGYKI